MSTACTSTPAVGPSLAALPAPDESAPPAMLVACPTSPNCASSVAANPDRQVSPFEFADLSASEFQAQLIGVVESDGGVVQDVREGYVWATYTSSVFRFVDDLEWLLDADNNRFDVRSASRVGYSDFGVNTKRVERLREALPTR